MTVYDRARETVKPGRSLRTGARRPRPRAPAPSGERRDRAWGIGGHERGGAELGELLDEPVAALAFGRAAEQAQASGRGNASGRAVGTHDDFARADVDDRERGDEAVAVGRGQPLARSHAHDAREVMRVVAGERLLVVNRRELRQVDERWRGVSRRTP